MKNIIITMLVILALVGWIGLYYFLQPQFQWLPIKIIIKAWKDAELYSVDLSQSFKSDGNLSVIAESIVSFSGMISNKSLKNDDFLINEYDLQKNWIKVATLDFGYSQSYTWYNDTHLIFRWQPHANSKDASPKFFLQGTQISILDLKNNVDFWIKVINPKRVWMRNSTLDIGEILGFIKK